MSLRNILYADTDALNNYMASIEGYVYDEATVTNNLINEKGGKAELGFSNISVGGNLSKQKEETSTITAKVTDASKLDKIIKYLEKENELKYYESIEESNWNDISRDDFLEVLVTPRFSKMEELANAANNMKQIVEVFQPFMDKPVLDSKTEEAINGFGAISKLKNTSSSTSCVFNFEDKKYPLVGHLNENYLKVVRDNFISQVYMLCKVQRKIEKGKSIELDEIFESMKVLAVNREQKRSMPKNLSNPKEIRDKINGPAFVIVPIAIYQ